MTRRASIRLARLTAALVIALVWTASIATGARAIQLTTIVLEGDDAPGAPFPFTNFTMLLILPSARTAPVVEENGRVSFLSGLPGGIWSGDGGALEKIIASLDGAPGGGTLSSINVVWSGGAGRSVIDTLVIRNQIGLTVLFGDGPGGLTHLVEQGAAAPGTPGVFGLIFDVPSHVGNSGEYAFRNQLELGVGGVTSANRDGVWAGTAGGSLELLLRLDDPAPGFDELAEDRCVPTVDGSGSDPATPVSDVRPFSSVALARDGTLAMLGSIGECDPGSRDVIWRREVGQLPTVIALTGDEVSGAGSQLQVVDRIALSDNGTLAFMGRAAHPMRQGVGVWSITPGGDVDAVAIAGELIPGFPNGAGFESSFASLSVADSGRVAFQGGFSDFGAVFGDALIAAGGELPSCAFAVEGAPAPGAPDTVFGRFGNTIYRNQAFESDANGNVAFLMELERGVGGVDATNDLGLWRRLPKGPEELIARTGDTLEVAEGDIRTIANLAFAGEGGGFLGHGGGIGPDGEVAFWASFTDDSEGVFVTDPASTELTVFVCPEPGATSTQLAALLVLLGLARRSRRNAGATRWRC